jgi:hypothetical protein
LARITKFAKDKHERPRVHDPTECNYSSYVLENVRYLQLDTIGSATRKVRGQASQKLQLDVDSARQLLAIIKETFPELK